MSTDYCYGYMCFVPLDANDPKFFGFAEFLTGLALMVLAWTIADVRYRFRVRTTPLPLQGTTFVAVAAIGTLTLLTDLWRAQQWLVPQGNLFTPPEWQALLGGVYFLTFLVWAWFAFIRPPVYSKRNAERYARALYRAILRGSPSELSIVADEFTRSANAVISFATDRGRSRNFAQHDGTGQATPRKPAKVTAYANDILLLIADKRFCRVVVDSSPGTALAVFQEIGKTRKYGVQVETFANNIVNEALANKNSFIYHEAEGYESGLIGYIKPLTQAMFSNYDMVETIGTLLDPDYRVTSRWDAEQWDAYCRVALMTFRDYVENRLGQHSFVLFRAKGYIENSVFDLYKLDGATNPPWDDGVLAILRVVIEFIQTAIKILDSKGVPMVPLRTRQKQGHGSFYDHLAGMIFEVIFHASAVKSPAGLCWSVQHNMVWHQLFNFDRGEGAAAKVIQFKVRRLIYDEVDRMRDFPNFKGARILGFCLNVMGFGVNNDKNFRDSRALQKAILSWTKKNYAKVRSQNPRVAEACLVDDMSYDMEHHRLVKAYPEQGLRRKAEFVYLDVEALPPEPV